MNIKSLQLTPKHTVKITPVYDTYWKFAAERQNLFMKRVNGDPPPWTNDEIIANHRFTNPYRASDRTSQYLIRNVIYIDDIYPIGSPIRNPDLLDLSHEDTIFRILLFKFFNKIDTWRQIRFNLMYHTNSYDYLRSDIDFSLIEKILDDLHNGNHTIYSAAYVIPSPPFNESKKHKNHLKLLEYMMKDDFVKKVIDTKSLKELYELIKSYPSIGSFLAFQYAIDINYSDIVDFSEMDFVVAGPGAKNGIKKCFADTAGLSDEDIIKAMTERASEEFDRLELEFKDLWGRPLQLIDCQNLFCEVDKYSRVAHPDVAGKTKRNRIKQKFKPNSEALSQYYPPKWNINQNIKKA